MMKPLTALIPVLVFLATPLQAELEWIELSSDKQSFVRVPSGTPFVPWGFNYDHDPSGRLLEDYWNDEWATVEDDFAEMKQLGANTVRVHLQFGKFMHSPTEPNVQALDQYQRLLQLAERIGLYLDVTGLGCYHKQDVPAWYDALDEPQRWQAQAQFWQAVAARGADSPAIFCYDLMNEPIVPGGSGKRQDWLGGAFAGKHFVQFIALETGDRSRTEVARQWIGQLTAAVRRQDRRHLITVGLVPWSLDRPGLTSGFVPTEVAGELDFIAMHLYPEKDKVDEALETLRGFAAAGKPVLIEEMFPLKCSSEELSRFIDASRPHAAGWIGFYWGKTADEYRHGSTLTDAIVLSWLELFQEKARSLGQGDR
jgi:hypothetical protein